MAKKVAVHPCRDCLVEFDSQFGGAQCERNSNAYVQPPAIHARLTTRMREAPARESSVDATRGLTTGDMTTRPLQCTEHGTLRPCANFWCAASTYSMEQKPTRTCSKKTHTQARDARCPHASELKQSIFSSHDQGDEHTGQGQRGHDPRQ